MSREEFLMRVGRLPGDWVARCTVAGWVAFPMGMEGVIEAALEPDGSVTVWYGELLLSGGDLESRAGRAMLLANM